MNGNSEQFILASRLVNYILLLQRNLQQGQAPNVISVSGGATEDLFVIAATSYGDVNLGFALAQANGLITPILSSTVNYQIVLPPLVPGS
jgi:hypothetical protein